MLGWVVRERLPGAERVVLFGASTGAAAAMIAAAYLPAGVAAVISRGGRVDLAGDSLPRVHAPVLLVVGGADDATVRCNREAALKLPTRPSLTVIPGAGHTFEEPGALGAVGERVTTWLEPLRARSRQRGWLNPYVGGASA